QPKRSSAPTFARTSGAERSKASRTSGRSTCRSIATNAPSSTAAAVRPPSVWTESHPLAGASTTAQTNISADPVAVTAPPMSRRPPSDADSLAGTTRTDSQATRADALRLRGADRLRRRELDLAHPRREGRTQAQLPRRRRAPRVRRDPGGSTTESEVGG